ncbi:8-oxoguanine DNA glycosylase OGG fold protein [Yeosuana sp.]|uniref:8-oxoguanine DNA glycosylase OGG fold protein n=1 Tax=Yeosuana sp. TaxID=2529388 RepID=UPI004054E0B0
MENKIHYEKFKEFVQQTPDLNQGAVGVSPRDFWKTIICDDGITFKGVEVEINELSEKALDRNEVLDILENKTTKFIIKIISIFAWGGMKVENGVMFFGHYNKYKNELEEILNNKTKDRKDIYEHILELNLKNCQPAYFTKLIFFFTARRQNPGYIMDQWTAKSINMITGDLLVKLDGSGIVKPSNKGASYERFCNEVESLAIDFKTDGAQIEQYLFDKGGKTKDIGIWRAYVKANYLENSKTLKKPSLSQKNGSKITKTNKKRQTKNNQGPFYLEKTKLYFALRYEREKRTKIGRIEEGGWLFAKEELVNLINDSNLNWMDSTSSDPENFKYKFTDFETCKTYLRKKGLLAK